MYKIRETGMCLIRIASMVQNEFGLEWIMKYQKSQVIFFSSKIIKFPKPLHDATFLL